MSAATDAATRADAKQLVDAGLAAAREAFLSLPSSLTIHSANGNRKGKISGRLDDRLALAIAAYVKVTA